MNSWWTLWMVFIFLFLLSPVGYGWGYRGWGPPYPRYVQRRRGAQAVEVRGSKAVDHHAWGWRGDFVWLMLLVAVFWGTSAFWWRA